jgi:hypothetical protein
MRSLLNTLLITGIVLVGAAASPADDFKVEAGFTLLLNGKKPGWLEA